MKQRISCGVLLHNELGQVLLAHVTGQRHWDIPKGGADPGETALEAALRECQEETGIALRRETLQDLGIVAYRPDKALHLFRTRVHTREVDVQRCVCRSHFAHHITRLPIPEMDDFRWAHLHEVQDLCVPAMTAVIRRHAWTPDGHA